MKGTLLAAGLVAVMLAPPALATDWALYKASKWGRYHVDLDSVRIAGPYVIFATRSQRSLTDNPEPNEAILCGGQRGFLLSDVENPSDPPDQWRIDFFDTYEIGPGDRLYDLVCRKAPGQAAAALGTDLEKWQQAIRGGQVRAGIEKALAAAVQRGELTEAQAARLRAGLHSTMTIEDGGRRFLAQRIQMPGASAVIDTYKFAELKDGGTVDDAARLIVRHILSDDRIAGALRGVGRPADRQDVATHEAAGFSVDVPAGWSAEVIKDHLDLKSSHVTIHLYPAPSNLTDLDAAVEDIAQYYGKRGIQTGPRQRLAFPGGEAAWTEAPGSERPYLGAVSRGGRLFFVNVEDKAKKSAGILEAFLAAVRSVRPVSSPAAPRALPSSAPLAAPQRDWKDWRIWGATLSWEGASPNGTQVAFDRRDDGGRVYYYVRVALAEGGVMRPSYYAAECPRGLVHRYDWVSRTWETPLRVADTGGEGVIATDSTAGVGYRYACAKYGR